MNLKLSHQDRIELTQLIDDKVETLGDDDPEASNLLALRKHLIERPNCPEACCAK